MAIELGKAYVQIVPSALGISNSIQKALKPEATRAGRKAGETISSNLSNALSSGLKNTGAILADFGSQMTRKVTAPALVAGSALTSLTLWKGFKRLSSLDTAQAKLRAIGIEGSKLTRVMDIVAESVEGNAFTMAEMTNVAATAIASGVKQGDELKRYLSDIGDAAAFAGSDLTDMAQIFNKVQTQGKLSMEVVQQLGARGIGVLGILSKETGKSMSEVSAAISAGEVSAEQFYDAMHKYMGGAAKEIGDTWDVALKNIGSRLGILGEKFLGNWKTQEGAFYVLKDVLQDINDFIPTLYDKAAALGEKFGAAIAGIVEKAKELHGHWASLDNSTQSMIKKAIPGFIALNVAIGPLSKAIGGLAIKSGSMIRKIDDANSAILTMTGLGKKSAGALGLVASKILSISGAAAKLTTIGGVIGTAIAGFGLLGTAFGDQINSMLILAAEKGPMIITELANGIVSHMPEIMACGEEIIMNLLDAIIANLPAIITAGMQIISHLILGLARALPNLIPAIVEVAVTIVNTLIENMPLFIEAALALITGLAEGLIAALPVLIEAIPVIIENLVAALIEALPIIIEAGITLFTALVQALPEVIPVIAAAIPQIVQGILNAIIENLPVIIDAGITLFIALIEAMPLIIEGIAAAMPDIINAIVTTLREHLPEIIALGGQLFLAIITAIPKVLPRIVKAAGGVVRNIVGAFGSLFGKMKEIGKDILRGIWQGVINRKNWLMNKLRGLPGEIADAFGSVSSKMKRVGKNIVHGIWEGITAWRDWLFGKVSGFFSGIVGRAKDIFKIGSPSKVFAWISKMNITGFIDTMDKMFPGVLRRVSGMMNSLVDIASEDLTMGASIPYKLSFAGYDNMYDNFDYDDLNGIRGGRVVNQTINVNQPVKSPVDFAREVRRETIIRGLAGA